ncbi:MAG TPA: hypothetical protein VF585_05120 [Chthoniobacterales bacterium]|jgi:hypothetical protein
MKPLLLLLALASFAYGQAPSPSPSPKAESSPLQGFWRATLPGGTFRIRLDRIQSVSIHEYTIEPLTRVTELNVDAGGSVVTRFYFLEVLSPQVPMGVGQSAVDLVKAKTEEAAAKVAGDTSLWKKVSKVYPATTHAHTVEYRVSSKEQLQRLMTSVEKAWSTNQGEEIKLD